MVGKTNIGALIVRIGFGVYPTIIIIRNPQNPILILKAPTLRNSLGLGIQDAFGLRDLRVSDSRGLKA